MINAQRLENIREYLLQNKYGNIKELAELFETSTSTIRRCLKQLENERFVESVRGGAVLALSGYTFEPPYQIKMRQSEDEKRRIAEAACEYIQSNGSIFLDASTTVYHMTRFITNKKNLSICTNDVHIACGLNMNKDVVVTVTGGVLRQGYYTLSGFYAEKMLSEMQVDCAFIGVDAVSNKGKFTITNTEELGIKRMAVEVANKIIVLCDHSKFNRVAFLSLWELDKVDIVITGKELEDDVYHEYTNLGMNIIRV